MDAAIAVGARRHCSYYYYYYYCNCNYYYYYYYAPPPLESMRSMTCTSRDLARSVLAWLLHRRLGVTAVRENTLRSQTIGHSRSIQSDWWPMLGVSINAEI